MKNRKATWLLLAASLFSGFLIKPKPAQGQEPKGIYLKADSSINQKVIEFKLRENEREQPFAFQYLENSSKQATMLMGTRAKYNLFGTKGLFTAYGQYSDTKANGLGFNLESVISDMFVLDAFYERFGEKLEKEMASVRAGIKLKNNSFSLGYADYNLAKNRLQLFSENLFFDYLYASLRLDTELGGEKVKQLFSCFGHPASPGDFYGLRCVIRATPETGFQLYEAILTLGPKLVGAGAFKGVTGTFFRKMEVRDITDPLGIRVSDFGSYVISPKLTISQNPKDKTEIKDLSLAFYTNQPLDVFTLFNNLMAGGGYTSRKTSAGNNQGYFIEAGVKGKNLSLIVGYNYDQQNKRYLTFRLDFTVGVPNRLDLN